MPDASHRGLREKTAACDFTLQHYRRLITSALAAGYRCVGCAAYLERRDLPLLLLRHDVDLSLADAARMAALEAEVRVRSTYFVRVSARRYQIDTATGRRLIREILAGGHEVGLHFEGPSHPAGAAAELRAARLRLEAACGARVRGGTIHLPRRARYQPTLDQLVESGLDYDPGEPRFNRGAVFFSDARRDWGRLGCPCQYLEAGHLYVVTHPFWWCNPDCDAESVVRSLVSESVRRR